MYKLDQKEELRRSEIMNLIDVLSSLAVGEMYFFGGEPLLVPQLVDFVRYAKRKGLKTKLDTNAFLLDEDMVKKLKEAGIDLIGISIDSPYETIHDKLRGINGIFKRAVTGIKYCIKHNIECYMSIYATKDNLKNGDLEKLINLAKSLGVRSRILSSILCGKWINRKDLVLTSREIMLLRSLLENYMVYLERDDIDSKEIPFLCSALAKDLFFISAHGDVQPCCYLPVSFGNIREQPLINIIKRMWKSSMFVKQERYNDCPMNCKNFRDKYVN
jgi:MoaA/NifB/PqqE/SkfB family radical SAM enzyme